MNASNKPHTETTRSELRRQQVLAAATECFRREGFHGSSITRISQAADMSPGHIYHYFANKEAIVEAIAEREEHDMAELLRKLEQDQGDGDVADVFTRQTREMVERNIDPSYAGLTLELAAEAARNPVVNKILQRSDREISEQFLRQAKRMGVPPELDDDELHLRLQILATLFQGLMLRSVVSPDLDAKAISRLIDDIIRFLLTRP